MAPPDSDQYHNLLPWMILNTITYLSEYGQSDCGFSHLETSEYMDVAMWEHRTFDSEIFRCGKIYYSNCIIITNFMYNFIGLKMSSLLALALKSPNNIFIWYLGNLSNTLYNYL
jgi:hypothetical protein